MLAARENTTATFARRIRELRCSRVRLRTWLVLASLLRRQLQAKPQSTNKPLVYVNCTVILRLDARLRLRPQRLNKRLIDILSDVQDGGSVSRLLQS